MNKHPKIAALESACTQNEVPDFRVGDTITIQSKIVDVGGKERLQAFTGTVMARKGGGISETVSLHRIAYGEGMERMFFIHSPLVASIKVVRRGKVCRSKLYYLRGSSGKAARVKGSFRVEKTSSVASSVSSEGSVTE